MVRLTRPDGAFPVDARMALLYDSTLEFPSKWSTQQLPSNGKSKKRPTAEFHEEEERPSRTERWAPCQLGLGEP